MNREDVAVVIRGIAPTLKKLQARIAALEARPELKYCGVFDSGTVYQAGHCVTKGGSLWICKIAGAGATPGVSPENWQLAVKAGRDAR